MIHSITWENFYSFAEENTINFTANKKAPDNHGYFIANSEQRLSKVEVVIGPNASGKTNALKVIPFLKWLIIDSFKNDPDALIPIKTFAFGKLKDKPSNLSVVFEIDSHVYTYSFSLDKNKIFKEELKLTRFIKEKKSTKKIFSRTWNEKKNSYDFDGGSFNLFKEFKKTLRTNASIISSAIRFNHPESLPILKYWQEIETNVVEAGWLGDAWLLNTSKQLGEAMFFFSKNNVLKKEAENLLSKFDLGLEGFEIKEKKKEGNRALLVQGMHIFDGKKEMLPMQYESSGTKQLFVLLRSILTVLDRGGVAVIDELDINLHPEIVLAIHELFINPKTNPNNAQLLMSVHSHALLNELDKYQIILVEKTENGFSELWRLDEVADVRSGDNYYLKYMAGAYNAIPRI